MSNFRKIKILTHDIFSFYTFNHLCLIFNHGEKEKGKVKRGRRGKGKGKEGREKWEEGREK